MNTYILIASSLVVLISLSGVIFLAGPLKRFLTSHLGYLSSFSAGVYIVTALLMIFEVTEVMSVAETVLFTVCGFFAFTILDKFLPGAHHHHHEHEDCNGVHPKSVSKKLIASDSVHNFGDGILIATAFYIDVHVGILTTVSICIHEFVQEVSEFILLKESGLSTREALIKNMMAASTVILGAVFGIVLKDLVYIQALLLAIAAGAFLQIVFVDVLPDKRHDSKSHIFKHMLYFAVGAALLFGVRGMVPHTHSVEGHDIEAGIEDIDHEEGIH